MSLKVGDAAPDFTLESSTGHSWRLSDHLGHRSVVLSFYYKSDTPICNKQVCALRDHLSRFQQAGAELVAISADSAGRQQRYGAKLNLPYPLLSDPDGAVRQLYGVGKTWGLLPGRVTIVIDRHGIIRHIFSSWFAGERHAERALQAITAESSAGRGSSRLVG